jgi:Sulfatase-modifying factor enzyme 1
MSHVQSSCTSSVGRTFAFSSRKRMRRRILTGVTIVLGAFIALSPRVEQAAHAQTEAHEPAQLPEERGGLREVSGIVSALAVKQSITFSPPDVETPKEACRAGMVEVEGAYCPALEQKCLRWLDPEMKLRCAEFDVTSRCMSKTQKKHFCMDKYEYPNKAGERPLVMKTWNEAAATCKSEGKRLCKDSEWTLACEGRERLPYPYGYARNAEACNIDRPHPEVDERALFNPKLRALEAARLNQSTPSGSHEACVSPYGVFDMAGNVDEWVVNESNYPYQSGSKGGYWGPVRTRCRPMTTAHYEQFAFYQLGFRCCGDASESELKPALQNVSGIDQIQGAVPAAVPLPKQARGVLAGS